MEPSPRGWNRIRRGAVRLSDRSPQFWIAIRTHRLGRLAPIIGPSEVRHATGIDGSFQWIGSDAPSDLLCKVVPPVLALGRSSRYASTGIGPLDPSSSTRLRPGSGLRRTLGGDEFANALRRLPLRPPVPRVAVGRRRKTVAPSDQDGQEGSRLKLGNDAIRSQEVLSLADPAHNVAADG